MTRRCLSRLLLLLVAIVLSVSLGCSKTPAPIEATPWRLTVWTLSSLNAADFTITAEFTDGGISGTGGVNTYTGPCTIGPAKAFAAGPFTSTEMAGSPDAMRAEGAYLTLLGQATSYALVGERLTLYDSGGNESLTFASARTR